MTLLVWVDQQNGKYTASVPGVALLRATGETRDDAIRELSQLIHVYQARGVLVSLNVPEMPLTDIPRRLPTAEELEASREMVAEIYRERDRLKALEFPE